MFEVVHLPREQWKGHILPIGYTAREVYDVTLCSGEAGYRIDIVRRALDRAVEHQPEDYDFPDRLYADWWPEACAWGVVADGALVAAIETAPEQWSNRLRVTELWVDPALRGQGLGRALLEVAKEQLRLERRRALILETQSCNVNAIGFYLHAGLTLIGLDTCCYANDDLQRGEVRLELGWMPPRRDRLMREAVEIRPETQAEWRAVEALTRDAFWNRYRPGCEEHYLLHEMRTHPDYLPDLSRVAVREGELLGAIAYTVSHVVETDGTRVPMATFGPLGVRPAWQGCGVGAMLGAETMELARAAGYPAIVIQGDPAYYARLGFRPASDFDILGTDGQPDVHLLAAELFPGALSGIRGRFVPSDVFQQLEPQALEAYDRSFPPRRKQVFPGQL